MYWAGGGNSGGVTVTLSVGADTRAGSHLHTRATSHHTRTRLSLPDSGEQVRSRGLDLLTVVVVVGVGRPGRLWRERRERRRGGEEGDCLSGSGPVCCWPRHGADTRPGAACDQQ